MDPNDVPMYVWECVICEKGYFRGHAWVFNRFEEPICRFCSGKLGKNINDFESVCNLVKESREEHRKGECTREKCGPLHSYGCAYHLRTDRKE